MSWLLHFLPGLGKQQSIAQGYGPLHACVRPGSSGCPFLSWVHLFSFNPSSGRCRVGGETRATSTGKSLILELSIKRYITDHRPLITKCGYKIATENSFHPSDFLHYRGYPWDDRNESVEKRPLPFWLPGNRDVLFLVRSPVPANQLQPTGRRGFPWERLHRDDAGWWRRGFLHVESSKALISTSRAKLALLSPSLCKFSSSQCDALQQEWWHRLKALTRDWEFYSPWSRINPCTSAGTQTARLGRGLHLHITGVASSAVSSLLVPRLQVAQNIAKCLIVRETLPL